MKKETFKILGLKTTAKVLERIADKTEKKWPIPCLGIMHQPKRPEK